MHCHSVELFSCVRTADVFHLHRTSVTYYKQCVQDVVYYVHVQTSDTSVLVASLSINDKNAGELVDLGLNLNIDVRHIVRSEATFVSRLTADCIQRFISKETLSFSMSGQIQGIEQEKKKAH